MEYPLISVISAAYRDWLYKDFYDSLARGAQVPFEVISVGPNPPTEPMPDNFKYIQTNVKPAQCLEIAARSAIGEHLIVGSDDVCFSEGFLNRLCRYIRKLDSERVLITFRYAHGDIRDYQLTIDVDATSSVFLGCAGCYRRDVWNQLGGIDKRWVGSFADVDMQLRFYEQGFRPFLAPDCIINEIALRKSRNKRLFCYSGISGRELLDTLWAKYDSFPRRQSPVDPFVDADILTKTQGNDVGRGKKGTFTYGR